ncbi:hypothetical protein [Psychrobacter sp. I-STPA10]|uniref:hypothetical protein n=1 Tax=Psychrobacter sp. I-STPA10 TaxID=2585769 RepID=UPI001E2966E9|nr:hypothetical protein [Psychrobacter sp. I-STPA10]
MKRNLQSIIFTLSTRPQMITRYDHIFGLSFFISGYFYGKDNIELEPIEVHFRDNFHFWVKSKYDVGLSQSWANIIYFYEGGGDVAINKFLELFKEFSDDFHRSISSP